LGLPVTISVSINAGAMALTVIPSLAGKFAKEDGLQVDGDDLGTGLPGLRLTVPVVHRHIGTGTGQCDGDGLPSPVHSPAGFE
jgi:hypothetical protein